ncbi:isoamylase early set domain-containing protein [Desulfovulcanus sp.]
MNKNSPDNFLRSKTDITGNDLNEQDKMKELLHLTRILKNMPDHEPPPNLANAVLRSLKPKKLSVWRRLYLWALSPRSITVSPLKLMPAAAASLALVLFLLFNSLPGHKNLLNKNGQNQELIPVTFIFHYPQAQAVSVIGSFNRWNPAGFEMRKGKEKDFWVLEIRLPKGRHEYAFLVNDKIVVADPNAAFRKRDLFGNTNSIIFVSNEHESSI